jgi:hypothetical protein
VEIAAARSGADEDVMNKPELPSGRRRILWQNVLTVISAAILVGAEVFGAGYAGGWALAMLLGLDEIGAHILQGLLFLCGLAVMVSFVRAAQRVEPFTAPS